MFLLFGRILKIELIGLSVKKSSYVQIEYSEILKKVISLNQIYIERWEE